MSARSSDLNDYTFYTAWIDVDQEYGGFCDQFPSLSWMDPGEQDALDGIRQLVDDLLREEDAERNMVHDWKRTERELVHDIAVNEVGPKDYE